MDARHDAKISDAIRNTAEVDDHFYSLTAPGGAGVLAGIFPEQKQALIDNINIALSLGAEEIFLAIHGSSDDDAKGCGGYVHSGHADEYASPQQSEEFSAGELVKAAKALTDEGITAPVRAFYVTFDAEGNNIVKEIPVG